MSSSSAPPVVAVVVTRDPQDWLDDCLSSLAAQDYGSLAVLVIDNGSGDHDAVVRRAAGSHPGAAVRRMEDDEGYGAAANRVTGLVEGAAFYLFCHDDVALAPDAVTTLVTEAVRSNAGIVGPKLVDWHDPRRILSAGCSVDRTGVLSPLVEPGELDQEQHDRVRDVFLVEGAATLVRSDLFTALGGFDTHIDYLGEDLDLCWRAHLAGARVLVVPDARARHLEALGERRDGDDRRRLRGRHRVRALLGDSSWYRLVWLAPVAAVVTLLEIVYALVLLRWTHARDLVHAWTWNLARPRSLRRKRKAVAATRQVSDGEIAHLQIGGSARLSSAFRGQLASDGRLQGVGAAGRAFAEAVRRGPQRAPAIAWTVVVAVAVFGSRHLLTRGIPSFGEFLPFSDAERLLGDFLDGRRDSGLGTDDAIPTAQGLLGVVGELTFGRMAGLREVLILGLFPVGWFGSWRLGGPMGSRMGRVALLLTYAALPIPLDAIELGSWTTLLCWAVAPHVVLALARLGRIEPFGPAPDQEPTPVVSEIARLGLLLAVAGAFAPVVVPGTLLIAVLLVVGALVVGTTAGAARMLAGTLGAMAVVVVVHLPWIVGLLGGYQVEHLLGRRVPGDVDGLGVLLRFDTGSHGHDLLSWGFVVAASVPLLIGRSWRLEWAARSWITILGSVGGAWVVARGWLDVPMPDERVLLTAAGPLVALSVGMGVAAFQRDLPAYRFGLPQVAVLIGTVGLGMAVLPTIAAAGEGQWDAPRQDLEAAFPFLSDDEPGGQRIVWIGDGTVLPAPGWTLTGDTRFTTSDDGPPDVGTGWPAPEGVSTDPIRRALLDAIDGGSARLGAALSFSGVRYVVVVEQSAPSFTGVPVVPAADRVTEALDRQLDLLRIPTDASVRVWASTAAVPIEARIDGAVATVLLAGEQRAEDGVGAGGPATEVEAGDGIQLARGADRWSVAVDGVEADLARAETGSLVTVASDGGEVTTAWSRPGLRWVWVVVQVLVAVAVWRLATSGVARRRRRGRRQEHDDEPVPFEELRGDVPAEVG